MDTYRMQRAPQELYEVINDGINVCVSTNFEMAEQIRELQDRVTALENSPIVKAGNLISQT